MADEERLNTMLPLSRVKIPVDETGPVSSVVLERSGTDPSGLLPQMIENFPVPVMVLDEQYRMLVANRATRGLFAEEASQFLGYSVSRFLSTERLGAAHTKLILTGRVQVYADTLQEARTERNVEVQLDRLVYEERQYLCMTLRDHTHFERESAERRSSVSPPLDLSHRPPAKVSFDRLERAHHLEALGQLTGSIAHDFNNLFLVVSISLEALEGRLKRGEDPQADLVRAQEAIARSQGRATEILRYARQHDSEGDAIRPARLLTNLEGLLQRAAGPGIELNIELDCDHEVKAPASQFETAVLNLVINARDALSDGGRIDLRLSEVTVDLARAREVGLANGTHLLLTIQDNGEGMSDEVQARAFEPFFTTKKADQGTGLGLSSVRTFMFHWGGGVRLVSSVKVGTSVELYFPLS